MVIALLDRASNAAVRRMTRIAAVSFVAVVVAVLISPEWAEDECTPLHAGLQLHLLAKLRRVHGGLYEHCHDRQIRLPAKMHGSRQSMHQASGFEVRDLRAQERRYSAASAY